MAKTLFDKVWDAHVVRELDGGRNVLYIDRQYIHEVTSPVAFSGMRERGLKMFRPGQITATPDHNATSRRKTNTCRSKMRNPRIRWTRSAGTARSSGCRCSGSGATGTASCIS